VRKDTIMLITTEARVAVVVDVQGRDHTFETAFDPGRLELHETVRREGDGRPLRPVRYLTLTIPLDEEGYGRALGLRDASVGRRSEEGK
jgi:hypothetical protein